MSDNKELLYAAISCAHEIDSESVILFRDPSKDGNALHQLGARLDAAAQPVVLSDERIIEIRNSIWDEVKDDDEYDQADIAFARAILAAIGVPA